jgi:uncharacterized protein (DUF1015 family)
MARIRPFRAWRYHPRFANRLGELTSPLFDVVDDRQRRKLYQSPLNSIHLSVPQGDIPAEQAARTLAAWRTDKVIVQDAKPAIYVYYQHFSLAGDPRSYCRKGFIAMIEAYDWQENVVLRHESTIPKAVNDRIDLLRATSLNVSPTHGLYTDPEFELEAYMDEAMRTPVYDEEDYQGVRDVLAVIDDPAVVARFVRLLAPQRVILADGHHRYEGSIAYRKEQREAHPQASADEGFNFHMMFFTNTEAHDLRILPTHRLLLNLPGFSETAFLEQLSRYFHLRELDDPASAHEVILGKPWAFGLLLEDQAYKIRLKPEVFPLMDWKFPDAVKRLDLTVMHYFIFERIFGIRRDEQRRSEHISFERSYTTCLSKVMRREAQAAIITNEVSIEQVKEVCASGYTMPQKSTYFYPKVICGFLFADVADLG